MHAFPTLFGDALRVRPRHLGWANAGPGAGVARGEGTPEAAFAAGIDEGAIESVHRGGATAVAVQYQLPGRAIILAAIDIAVRGDEEGAAGGGRAAIERQASQESTREARGGNPAVRGPGEATPRQDQRVLVSAEGGPQDAGTGRVGEDGVGVAAVTIPAPGQGRRIARRPAQPTVDAAPQPDVVEAEKELGRVGLAECHRGDGDVVDPARAPVSGR